MIYKTIRSRLSVAQWHDEGNLEWWGRQILIVLIFRIEPEGTCTKEKRQTRERGMEEKRERKFKVAIDRYIGLPIFSLIVKHFNIIDIGFEKKTITDFFFILLVTYTIIQSITSSEMCSLYFTHTWSSDTVHSGEAPARPPQVTLYKINLFETH